MMGISQVPGTWTMVTSGFPLDSRVEIAPSRRALVMSSFHWLTTIPIRLPWASELP